MKPVIENAPKVGSRHFMSLVYLLVLTLCLTLVNMGHAQNLLNNPSFETGNLNSWTNHNSRTVTGHNQCSSTYAAWINHTGSGSSTYNYISQEVSASPGKRYALNFRAQRRNSNPNRARLQAIDASGNVLSEQNTEIDNGSWSSYELVVVGVPEGTVKVRARIETNNGGQVKVDCFDLRETTSPSYSKAWRYECTDGQTVDIYASGADCSDNPDSEVTIPSSASVTKAVLEVVYKSDHPSSPITAYVNGGTSVSLFEVAIAGGSSGEYVYRGEYIGEVSDAYHNTASGHCGNGRGLQSLVVYAFRNQTDAVNSSGQFTSISGYCDLQGFAIGIPTETQPRDLTMFLPVSELTTDGRFMTITATAGGVTSSKTIFGPPSGECCVDVVEITLNNVAGNVNVIDIDIDTRSSSNPNGGGCGQSYVISGGIKVEAECPPPPCEDFTALAESDLNLVIDRTISNSHPTCQSATPDRVFWANCLFDETTGCPNDYKYWKVTGGTSFKEYTDGTAYLSMEIQNVQNSNYRFDVEVIFEGRTQSPPTGSPKLGICTASSQGDWYYYEVTEGSLIGKNGLAGAVLAIDRNGPAFQVGTGANLYESGKFGASGWLNYTIFEQPTAFNLSDNAGFDFNFLLSGGAFDFGATAESICSGETAQLNAYATGGIPPYTFQWSHGLGSGSSKTVTPSSNTTYTVTVTDSEGCSGTDEVLVEVDECSSLGDKVWIDKNGNGKQDGGEPGLDGVTVQLKNASGSVIDTRVTSGGGMYLFDNLTGGTYSVGFIKPSGYEFTIQNEAADDVDSDPNPNTGMTANIALGSNEENLTVDAGLYKPASLGDYVWLDENKNGIQDGGEKALKDIVVKLFDSNNKQIGSSTLTNASGQYFFGDLAPGQYYVKFELPSGLMFTLDNEGTNDTKDSDVDNSNGSGTTPLYTLTSGEYDPDIDAGGKCTVTVDAGSDKTICDGGCVEIKATASNGSGTYTYSWSHGLGSGRTHNVCPTSTTTYTVTVTDVNGCCIVTDHVKVTVNNNVNVNAGPDQTICKSTCADLEASASGGASPYTYKWSSGQTTKAINVCPTSDKTYTVTVTDNNGCSGTDAVKVKVYTNLTTGGKIAANQSNCGPFDPAPFTSITPASGGTGTTPIEYIWLKSTTSCSPPTSINDPNWTIIGGANGLTYDPGIITQNTCFIRCARRKGCPDYDGESNIISITIFRGPSVHATASPAAFCEGGCSDLTANPSGGASPYTYKWSNGQTTKTINVCPTSDKSYTVTVTDNNGCKATDKVDVTVYDNPVVNAGPDQTICKSTCADLEASASGGKAPYTYKWSNGDNTKAINVCPASDKTYTVTVTDANGCKDTDVVKVKVYTNLTTGGQIAADQSNCGPFNPAPLTSITPASGGTGTTPIEYIWLKSTTTCSRPTSLNDPNWTIIGGANGLTYDPGFTTQNTCFIRCARRKGCPDFVGESNIISITIFDGPSVTATAGESLICESSCTELTSHPSGGQAPYRYKWSNGRTTKSINVCPAATTSYTVTVTDANGCSAEADVKVNIKECIDLELIKTVDNPTPPVGSEVTFTISVKNNGPSQATGVVIKDYAPNGYSNLDASLSGGSVSGNNVTWTNQIIPNGGTINLKFKATVLIPGAGVKYQNLAEIYRADQEDTDSTPGNDPDNDGDGKVGPIDDDGSKDEDDEDDGDDATVMPYCDVVADAGQDAEICFGTCHDLKATASGGSGSYYYQWDNGLGVSATHQVCPTTTTTYTVTVTDLITGCTDVDAVNVKVVPGVDVDAGKNQSICNTECADLKAYPVGGVAPYTYKWSNGSTGASISVCPSTSTSYTVTITDRNGCKGTDIVTVEVVECGSIGDFVWEDLNGNGMQDVGEPGIGSVTVKLTDGVGNPLDQTTTNQDGYYLFDLLRAGSYRVMFVQPQDYDTFTSANVTTDNRDSDANQTTGMTGVIILSAGEDDLTNDAGLLNFASIGDYVWEDLNGNGIQEFGEPGVNGILVKLKDKYGAVVQSQSTSNGGPQNKAGYYLFENLMPGEYSLEFEKPFGFDYTGSNSLGSNDSNDSDVDFGGLTPSTVLTSGEKDLTFDAGLIQPGSIGDFIWDDLNIDGVQDPNEPGKNGISILLYTDPDLDGNPNELIDSEVSRRVNGKDGFYQFTDLKPGGYILKFVAPADCYPSPQLNTVGNDPDDSDADENTGFTSTIVVVSGSDDPTNDAGFYKKACIGNYVWEDANGDGIQDRNENGIDGVDVYLYDENHNLIQSAVTSSMPMMGMSGWYKFCDIEPGRYYVKFDASGVDDNLSPTLANIGPDDTDSDIDGTNGAGTTDWYELESGEVDLTADAGFIRTACIGDYVWDDIDNDGVQDDATEWGINGAKVYLYNQYDELIATTITVTNMQLGVEGWYQFCDVSPGDYYVKFDVKRVHSDFELSKVNNTTDDKDSDVTEANGPNTTDMIWIGPGDNFLDIDAAYYKPASLGNYIWEDINLDGIQNEDVSSGLNDFVVRLYASDGEHISTQTSRDNETTGRPGYFCFDNLASGDYYVEFEVPSGMTFQPTDVDMTNDANDSDIGDFNGENTTIVYSVAPGQNLENVDAGFWKACVLGNYVWEDNGGPGKWMNGIQDTAESGLEGVTVMVYDVVTHEPLPDMAPIVTDSDGEYEFLVKPGDYYLAFTPPARYIASPMKTGWDNEMDCDVGDFFGNNTTQAFSLAYGQDDLTIDAGFFDLALSIDLLTFDAKLSGQDVLVTWTTLNEANSDYYVVERSYESTSDFVDVGMLDAAGNFRGTLDYEFNDHLFQSGIYYYRLRSVDQSGSFKHSKIVGVDLTDEVAIGELKLYPNPTSGLINITADGTLSGIDMITVYDARGVMVRNETNQNPDLMIDLGDLTTGVYWIEVVIGDHVTRNRLVISR